MSTYNSIKAYEAQYKYCCEHDYPMFAPRFLCYRCGRDIYSKGGISVEEAGKSLITSCPFCRKSFDD